MIQRSFSLYSYGISRGECEICRPLLERGVHQELFMWIEEHLFLTDVGNYISFLRSILLKDSTGLWMEQKEAMQMAKGNPSHIWRTVVGKKRCEENTCQRKNCEALKWKKSGNRYRKQGCESWKRKRRSKRNLIFCFGKIRGQISFSNRSMTFITMEDMRKIPLRARIILSYMRDYLDRRGKIVTSKEEIKYLLLLFQNLYKRKDRVRGHRQMVDLMEVA